LLQLWRRVAFNVAVSNVDDHLRNHGFILTPQGWKLAQAYDMNPVPYAKGLSLNISEHSNALDMDLVLETAPYFRISNRDDAVKILNAITKQVAGWRDLARATGLGKSEQDRMAAAFKVSEAFNKSGQSR
jgi:serine/threonine-protein kinase HipA